MSAAAGQGVKWARAFAFSMAICMAMGPTCIPFAWSASMFAVVEVSRTTLMSGVALYWPLAPRRSVSGGTVMGVGGSRGARAVARGVLPEHVGHAVALHAAQVVRDEHVGARLRRVGGESAVAEHLLLRRGNGRG